MDHRWDESLERERAARAEAQRYGRKGIAEDREVEERDRARELERRRRPQSAWDIGAAHWNQRDTYTRNARIDDAGYGLGPRVHPEEGSYAYPRSPTAPEHEPRVSLYEREAWPWLNYEPRGPAPTGLWDRLKLRVGTAFGRGPKGFHRSDARILEDVSEALSDHGQIDARDIEVSVKDADVTLEGTVPDRHTKKLAEDVAERCPGVHDVHNRLRVRRDDDDALVFATPARAF